MQQFFATDASLAFVCFLFALFTSSSYSSTYLSISTNIKYNIINKIHNNVTNEEIFQIN